MKNIKCRKLAAWNHEHSTAASNVAKYIANPLNAFLLIKRTTVDYELVVKRLENELNAFSDNIRELKPSEHDLSGAVEGLLRLQPFYKQRSSDFAKGIIDGEKTRAELSAHDLYVIGVEANKLGNQEFFVKEYFQLALRMFQTGKSADEDVDELTILQKLIEVHEKCNEYDKAISTVEIFVKRFPDNEDGKTMLDDLLQLKEEHKHLAVIRSNPYKYKFRPAGEYSKLREMCLYGQVCRGETLKTPKEMAELRCRYISKSFFSKIAPFKIEEANLDPYLVIYHDVLFDSEIEILKNITKPKIYRAEISQPGGSVTSNHARVAQIAWFTDDSHEVVRRISRRVEVSFIFYSNDCK